MPVSTDHERFLTVLSYAEWLCLKGRCDSNAFRGTLFEVSVLAIGPTMTPVLKRDSALRSRLDAVWALSDDGTEL